MEECLHYGGGLLLHITKMTKSLRVHSQYQGAYAYQGGRYGSTDNTGRYFRLQLFFLRSKKIKMKECIHQEGCLHVRRERLSKILPERVKYQGAHFSVRYVSADTTDRYFGTQLFFLRSKKLKLKNVYIKRGAFLYVKKDCQKFYRSAHRTKARISQYGTAMLIIWIGTLDHNFFSFGPKKLK